MTEYGKLNTRTFKAAADMSGAQYHLLRFSDADTVNVASQGAIQTGAGVLLNKPSAANRAATVAVAGSETKVVAGAAITAPDLFTCNGSGRATAAGSGDFIFGMALQDAGADGDIIRCQLEPFGPDIHVT